MKYAKYVIGIIAFVAFLLLIDDSGIGFKSHIQHIKSWAEGESKHLRFELAKDTRKKQ